MRELSCFSYALVFRQITFGLSAHSLIWDLICSSIVLDICLVPIQILMNEATFQLPSQCHDTPPRPRCQFLTPSSPCISWAPHSLTRSTPCSLNVHHSNPALRSLLGCPALSDYESLLGELLSTEHMLRAVLHDSCLCMLEGIAVRQGAPRIMGVLI